MKRFVHTCALLLAASFGNAALAAPDALRAVLEDSKASGKGLSFYVNGQAIAGVVASIDDHYVVARSQAQGTIVLRLDRIDGVAGFVGQPGSERKTQ